MKHPRKKLIILSVFIAMTFGFIFGNSLLPSERSNAISDIITETVGGEIVSNAEERANASTWFTSDFIRKSAHIAEFAVLGAEFTLLLRLLKKLPRAYPLIFLIGSLSALTDETLQSFSDRTSCISDVWIDILGFVLGTALVSLPLYFLPLIRKKSILSHFSRKSR